MTVRAQAEAGLARGPYLPILTAIALCFLLQAWLALKMEINWDEFFYLSNLYAYDRGELTKPLQSFQVHLLEWVTKVPGDEVDQIVVARFAMLACEAGTCALIYRLARCFADSFASLVGVLCYASAGYTIIHGASFRADPLAALFAMSALTALACGRMSLRSGIVVSLSGAVGVLVTLKVALYAPAFAGVAVWRLVTADDREKALRWLASIAAASAALTLLLYGLQLLAIPRSSVAGTQAILDSAGRATLLEAGLFPRAAEAARAALLAPVQTILLLLAVVGAGMHLLRNGFRKGRSAWFSLACAAPLLCLLFYRNAFPYFFAFILPPAMTLIAWQVSQARFFRRIPLLCAALLVTPAVLVAAEWSTHGQQAQRQLVSAVHGIFREPVAYIDRNGILSRFPKRGFFMSTWGIAEYRKQPPLFEQALAREPIPLLILDSPTLEQALGRRSDLPSDLTLRPEDARTLQETYIPYWGPIWVAGVTRRVGSDPTEIRVRVPGPYTVARGGGIIDGRIVHSGEVVQLQRGTHSLSATEPGTLTLFWGNKLARPSEAPLDEPIYRGF